MAPPNSCGTLLWCCGSLQTGATTVGVADLILILMSVGHYVESVLNDTFGLGLVAFCLVMLFLFASSCLMLHGVLKKQRLLLLPWMVMHLGAIVGAIIFCSIQFDKLQGQRAMLIIGAAIQTYFFIVVFLHYIELGSLTEWPAVREQPEGQDLPDLGEYRKNNCLIDLETFEEKPDTSSRSSNHDLSFAKDDTFTQLATSRQVNGSLVGVAACGAAGTSATVAGSFAKAEMALPTPEEVISLPAVINTKEPKEEPNVAIPRRSTTWKSSATLDFEENSDQALLPQAAKSESKILLAHVDNNFSPFRSKGAAQNGPKMKVFLPTKSSGESADDDNSSSSSSEDENHIRDFN